MAAADQVYSVVYPLFGKQLRRSVYGSFLDVEAPDHTRLPYQSCQAERIFAIAAGGINGTVSCHQVLTEKLVNKRHGTA